MNEIFPAIPADPGARMNVRVEREISSLRRKRTRNRRIAAITAGSTLLMATTGGAVALFASQKLQDRSAYCYAENDLTSDYSQVGIPDTMTAEATGETVEIRTPNDRAAASIELCAAVWAVNVMNAPQPAEQLVPCLRTDNVIAVLPSFDRAEPNNAEFCRAAGMPPAHSSGP
ncbi:hypothetical protein [Leucobacter triazinivorans]|uniref:Uncharacterized protein n=1 Tax=Leucobacter triazinivorans TaxID=1784719 RepID=A0A4P6KFL5_9MICO|nr:hypothetical protein [Leucobacter triazinivorans]QBE49132.1 hypothetical protein EVS81_09985 [Leucobacter triazinivorans]